MQNRQIAGNPLEFLIPSLYSNIIDGRANSPGYGKNLENWAIRSQVLLFQKWKSNSMQFRD